MFGELHKPKKTVFKWVMKKHRKTGVERLVKVFGYPDTIETPSGYDRQTNRFLYKVI
jgi:hypothetical protein